MKTKIKKVVNAGIILIFIALTVTTIKITYLNKSVKVNGKVTQMTPTQQNPMEVKDEDVKTIQIEDNLHVDVEDNLHVDVEDNLHVDVDESVERYTLPDIIDFNRIYQELQQQEDEVETYVRSPERKITYESASVTETIKRYSEIYDLPYSLYSEYLREVNPTLTSESVIFRDGSASLGLYKLNSNNYPIYNILLDNKFDPYDYTINIQALSLHMMKLQKEGRLTLDNMVKEIYHGDY